MTDEEIAQIREDQRRDAEKRHREIYPAQDPDQDDAQDPDQDDAQDPDKLPTKTKSKTKK